MCVVFQLGMGETPAPMFGSLQEELGYWKELAAKHQQRYLLDCAPIICIKMLYYFMV